MAIAMLNKYIIILVLSSSIWDILPCLPGLLGNQSSDDICNIVDDTHLITCLFNLHKRHFMLHVIISTAG
jgi:hypothetical protein